MKTAAAALAEAANRRFAASDYIAGSTRRAHHVALARLALANARAMRRAAQQEADARNAEARAAYLRDFDARAARRAQAWADYAASRA